MKANWILKAYMKLPLAGKVIVPLAAILLVKVLITTFATSFKFALILAAIGVVAYFILKFAGKKKSDE